MEQVRRSTAAGPAAAALVLEVPAPSLPVRLISRNLVELQEAQLSPKDPRDTMHQLKWCLTVV